MPRWPIPVCAVLVLAATHPAHAQGDIEHRGAWGTFTLGTGSVGVDCGFCPDERQWGPSGFLAFGGTLSPKVLVGGGTAGYARTSGTELYLGWLLGLVRFYPGRRLGLFLSGGAGLNYGRGTTQTDDFDALGAGFLAGLGWDFGLASNLGITLVANGLLSAGGYLEQNGVQASGSFNPTMLQVALGLTFF